MNPQASLPVLDIGLSARDPRSRADAIVGVGAEVEAALTDNGFMYAVGHGIDAAVVARAFAVMRWFFSQSREFKTAYNYRSIDANFGYQGMEAERLDPAAMPDLKESFTMRNALQQADEVERWPAGDFRDAALSLYTVGLRAAFRIMEILAARLGLEPDFFTQSHRGENVTLRFLHYPADAAVRSAAQLGAGAHTDYGSITLLFQDEVGGLELRTVGGGWMSAPPMAEAAVINTGDLMERWTNGRFRSTEHRVRPIRGRRDRYSIALFVDPDASVVVDCIASCITPAQPKRHPAITAGEHIRQKIAATHEASV